MNGVAKASAKPVRVKHDGVTRAVIGALTFNADYP
jgi:hypothetical protein